MLTVPSTSISTENIVAPRASLPTPPMTHTALPPLKMRLRSRKSEANGDVLPRKKVVKRSVAPPRGVNKRRRAIDDDMGRDDESDSDLEFGSSFNNTDTEGSRDIEEAAFRPSTPKRARIAPEVIPLGLERADYHNLHAPSGKENMIEGTEVETEADGELWSKEDDRILVELVLEKLKLSKTDWQDCARSLGKDRGSIGRRWRSLMINGDVGLKSSRNRRGKIHGTWR